MLQREYQLARLVEAHIEVELTNYSELEVFSTPYRNGREKGLVFSHYDGTDAEGRVRPIHVFAFTHRHTGSFVCVTSKHDDIYSDAEYENCKTVLYSNGKAPSIANYILSELLGEEWRNK
jgi:hypothetical protein